ncbi:putative disease resistance protein RGA4 [Hordeum vulgare subsp. vulgare]|uniref:putative disease resistance protein RGA4 n=1 Tax=Hordeum vulgare subsp. vulgare TaxID=112509 RepID=UPI001D1A5208|nr:putative disease resistance protein RGA4 [Hordeum vulgare subsp. vulgare]
MLERAATKELVGLATEKLLQNLQNSAHNAEDLLDELDYFRIHDKLHNTYEAADEHGKGCVCDIILNARHTAKALGKQMASVCANCFGANASHPRQEDARQNVNCCTWQRGRQRSKMSAGHSPSAPNANPVDQGVSGCMPKLGKLFQGSSSPHPHVSGDENRGNGQETPMPKFNRVDFSRRMKETVEQLKLRSEEVNKILTHCGPRTVLDIAQRRPATTPQSAEPKLYGRDRVINSMIHDITEGQYCDMGLTVLPVIGPGGMGKTTLIQHIYNNQQVQNHFPVRIWICVSFSFNLGKVLEQIKEDTLTVEGENGCSTTQELIEHRLKHKRFLLVLDDIWQFTDVDDWKKLLLMLGKSQEKGSMILVTTRQKEIADQVKKTVEPKELNGLEPGEFKKLFLVYIFDAEQYPRDKLHLLNTGDEIMGKLKCSPLAAKTVGRLLSKDLSLLHWRRVLNSKEWAKQIDDNGIMPALKLSYDFLPFHLQQCFFYSALFPEDYFFRSEELISLWIGLDISIPAGQNQTLEDIGLRNLKELVIHGFFREDESDGDLCYVMHDLLHDLALQVASHYCLSLRLSDVGSMEIQPSIRHLSISTDDLGEYDAMSAEKLKSELEELKKRFTVEDLQTLMLFGEMDEGFVKIFGDFLGEVSSLRVLHLPNMFCPVESMLHNFLGLIHLQYLCLGTNESEMHLPLGISKFYHLRILNLEKWHGSRDLPEDMCNLAKLCHFYVPSDAQFHSDIYNVGKLKHLEELKLFQVNKKSEGFEPKQLKNLTKLRELGIYNLEKIHTEEEAAQAKLIEKNYLRRLTLCWDSERSSVEPSVEAAVLEILQPHGDLQVLCIRGHGGPSCPTWLGDEFAVEALQSLYLDGVSWEVFPSLGKAWDLHELRLENIARLKDFIVEKSFCRLIKLTLIGLGSFEKWVYTGEQESSVDGDLLPPDAHMFPLLQVLIIRKCPKLLGFPFPNHIVSPDWFPKLQELEVTGCPEFSLVILISWIESLRHVMMQNVKLLASFWHRKSSNGAELEITGKADLHSIDQVLVFDKETGLEKLTLERCPPLELKHLLMLTSLKTLIVVDSDWLVGPLGGGQSDVEWQLPVEHIWISDLNGNVGEELTELLPHLPKLSKLEMWTCKNIKKLVVGVDVQQTTLEASDMGGGEITAAAEEEDDGVLLFPPHLCDSLRELEFRGCQELVLVDPPTLVPGGGGLQALRSLQRLAIQSSPKFLSTFSFSCHIFPSSLQSLELWGVQGMGTLEPLSNLSGLTRLILRGCGEDLKRQVLLSLLTTGGQLKELRVMGSPRFFVDWDPNPRRALEVAEGGEEQQTQLVSSTLQELSTDDIAGLLAAPVCRFLSSSVTKLALYGYGSDGMERFSREQEDALQLLSSLQELEFWCFKDLQQLPAGLRNLTSLKLLSVKCCPAISSLPNDALPDSLENLDVYKCSEELKQYCRGLEGTIPKIITN